jgi:1-pyrroline-5-carboxylate dehydrogenase
MRLAAASTSATSKSTGAMMGVYPFGGFNMSGTDSKAGGPDYSLFFLEGKAVGERHN